MVGTPLSRHLVDTFDVEKSDLKPLWTLENLDDEEKLLVRLNGYVDTCEKFYSGYFALQQQNLLVYQGLHWLTQDKYNNRFMDNVRQMVARKTPRIVLNHCYDFVEHNVSQATRYRPAVAIYPANREQTDADNAKVSKDVLDYIWYQNNIDLNLQQLVRHTKIFGEGVLGINYNFNKGDVHPDYLKLNGAGQRAPVMRVDGTQVTGADGTPLFIDKIVKTGDVEYTVKPPWHYFEQPCTSRDDIEWCIEWSCEDVDYLKAKYPEKSEEIFAEQSMGLSTDTRFDYGRMSNHAITYRLYHIHSEFMGKGRYIKFTRSAILENTDLPFGHGKLPYIKLHDIDVPDCIRGMSFLQQIFPINHQINACASLAYKMLVLLGHPKIAMPDGACEMSQLLNEATVLSYQGGVPPTLLHMNPPTGELMAYMEAMERVMEKLGGNFEMSRGQAPSGVRAAKALRVLEEQEDKRGYGFITKYNQTAIVDNAKMTLSVAGTYYDDSDGRLARIVGKDNEYRIRQFKSANLAKSYDIRIENTTALSQSPAARFDEINEMMQVRFDPQAPLSREQYTNLLDLGASDQFKDIVTRSVRCAQSENEDIISGAPVAPPTQEEDLIVHWNVHLQAMQGRDYKEITPPDRKAQLVQHMKLTEYLMFEKAFGIMDSMGMPITMGNPGFAAKMQMECINYPVFFQMPVPPPPPGMMTGGGSPPIGPTATDPTLPPPTDQGEPLPPGADVGAPPVQEPAIG